MSVNFPLLEFIRASQRPLTSAETSLAVWWADQVLEPARDRVGAIRISSYVRTTKPGTSEAETGSHKNGQGIDVVPLAVTNRALADILAETALAAGTVRQVITYDYGAHVHIARSLVTGAAAGYLAYDGRAYNATAPEPRVELARSWSFPRVLGAGAVLVLVGVVVVRKGR